MAFSPLGSHIRAAEERTKTSHCLSPVPAGLVMVPEVHNGTHLTSYEFKGPKEYPTPLVNATELDVALALLLLLVKYESVQCVLSFFFFLFKTSLNTVALRYYLEWLNKAIVRQHRKLRTFLTHNIRLLNQN